MLFMHTYILYMYTNRVTHYNTIALYKEWSAYHRSNQLDHGHGESQVIPIDLDSPPVGAAYNVSSLPPAAFSQSSPAAHKQYDHRMHVQIPKISKWREIKQKKVFTWEGLILNIFSKKKFPLHPPTGCPVMHMPFCLPFVSWSGTG